MLRNINKPYLAEKLPKSNDMVDFQRSSPDGRVEPQAYRGRKILALLGDKRDDIWSTHILIDVDTYIVSSIELRLLEKITDQVTIKGVWTNEANAELEKALNSKKQYIGLTGKNVRTGSNEAIQALYSLTLILKDSKHERPVFW